MGDAESSREKRVFGENSSRVHSWAAACAKSQDVNLEYRMNTQRGRRSEGEMREVRLKSHLR